MPVYVDYWKSNQCICSFSGINWIDFMHCTFFQRLFVQLFRTWVHAWESQDTRNYITWQLSTSAGVLSVPRPDKVPLFGLKRWKWLPFVFRITSHVSVSIVRTFSLRVIFFLCFVFCCNLSQHLGTVICPFWLGTFLKYCITFIIKDLEDMIERGICVCPVFQRIAVSRNKRSHGKKTCRCAFLMMHTCTHNRSSSVRLWPTSRSAKCVQPNVARYLPSEKIPLTFCVST